ncbi:hypothetical protein ACLI4R_00735 [Natrialbaceae archaeon A-chndr2]
MFEQTGLERRDGRNLLISIGIMTLLLFSFTEGDIGTRIGVALAGGLVSGLTFVVFTVVIKRYAPSHWQ